MTLSAKKVESRLAPGMYGDGRGLYLHVARTGSKSWICRATVKGATTKSGKPLRVEVGLGSFDLVSLAEARELAVPIRRQARQGINPVDARRKEIGITFEAAARAVHSELLPTWRNARHAESWLQSLVAYAFPVIGEKQVAKVTPEDLLTILKPIWTTKTDTATKLKQRMSAIFDWARAHGHYAGENPAAGIKKGLPVVKASDAHHTALPWQDLPAFMLDLQAREGVSARCLSWIILTACRSNEARGARWAEVDLQARVWTIPGDRTKTGKAHAVPLCPEALQVLREVWGLDRDLIFPTAKRGADGKAGPMSDMVFKALFIRMGRDGITAHGFRSTFRDWSSEAAHADRAVAEAALAHVLPPTERAYARSDLLARRRELMALWGAYTGLPRQIGPGIADDTEPPKD